MKQQSFIFKIPKPCSENWNEMTPGAQGRFCSHCQKTVIDFTTWNDADLISFFKNNDQPTCGHFFNTQLNRPLTSSAQKPTKLYRIAIALGLTLLLAQAPNAYSRPKAPLVGQNILSENKNNSDSTTTDSSTIIRGIVLDAKGEPAIGAIVSLSKRGINKGGGIVDIDGFFKIVLPHRTLIEDMELSIKYTAHETLEITLSKAIPKLIKVKLTLKDEIITTGALIRYVRPFDPPGKTTYTREDINHIAH